MLPYVRAREVIMEPSNVFHIEFNTKDMPGAIVATQVTLEKKVYLRSQVTDDKIFRIDLSSHPLYRKLYAYCMANPPE